MKNTKVVASNLKTQESQEVLQGLVRESRSDLQAQRDYDNEVLWLLQDAGLAD